ncbi:MAG: NADH-quinone oxidoreductase subunit J [Proteobacteria bacterium]|nr:NADH-quinone oxidoreductase subunit J [Pseudomonadota bacterium]MBU1648738.1 NADH-quinone oxidoreductase subunit J [Pseudomonadota bacterium]
MVNQLLFLYCALVIIGTALLTVRFKNPVHSVLAVLVLFFHMAGLYLLLNAEFLAAIQIIVYAGAILVLYLFVLFLVNLRQEVKVERFVASHRLSALVSICLGICLLAILPFFKLGAKGNYPVGRIEQLTHTKAMGLEIYSTFLLPFEIAGLILLIAVIGGLVLARNDKEVAENELSDSPSAGTCEVQE